MSEKSKSPCSTEFSALPPDDPSGQVEEVAGEADGDRLRDRRAPSADGVGEVDGAEDDARPQRDLALAETVDAKHGHADATEHALLAPAHELGADDEQDDDVTLLSTRPA